jgi:hypothetical protein
LDILKRKEEGFKLFQTLPDTNHTLTLQSIPEERIYHLYRTERQNTRKLLFNEGCTPGLLKLLGFVVLGRRRGRCLIQGGILAFGWKD